MKHWAYFELSEELHSQRKSFILKNSWICNEIKETSVKADRFPVIKPTGLTDHSTVLTCTIRAERLIRD